MSDTRGLVDQFASLFEGRKDAYGADHGECVRLSEAQRALPRITWNGLWQRHLYGIEPIGIYPVDWREAPVDPGWMVKWGCSDLDNNDLQAALNLRNALDVLDITAWIEVSRSKGYHVWVFAKSWVPAAFMRRALLVAHQIADVPPTEVNPKHETLEPGQVGNYVRLPYPGGLQSQWNDGRRHVLANFDHGTHMPFKLFLIAAEEHRTWPSVLADAASLYVPPKAPITIAFEHAVGQAEKELVEHLNGLAFTIYRDGPLAEGDRSGTLFKLAVNAFKSGLDPNEVFEVVRDADERWGKFSGRRDGPQQLERIVARAASA